MAEVNRIEPTSFETQNYLNKDSNLIQQFDIDTSLANSSYIEFFIYNNSKNLIHRNYNYKGYKTTTTQQGTNNVNALTVDPEFDVTSEGFENGTFIAYYNFLTRRIGNNLNNLFIKEISSDRKEIRLDTTVLSNLEFTIQTQTFVTFRENQDYFVDFYLNFSNNNLIIANNIKLEDEGTDNPTVLVKLYEPLPSNYNLKDELWVVTTLNEPEAFRVTYPDVPVVINDTIQIQGPNNNISLKDQINNSSQLLSYNDIISGAPPSSINQIDSLLEESSINISVDYTNFDDFIHFSSLQTRLENFYYKIQLIESYTSESQALNNITSSNTSVTLLEAKKSEVIKNFDKFEYFMYYDSGSMNSWPKSNLEPPYILYPSTSSQVLTWFGTDDEFSSNYGGLILSASDFDNANPNELKKAIPEYLRENPDNKQYDLFVDMVAQYYDNVWLYTKDVTQKYNADNRLDFGVSKDLVSKAITDFGIKLYQNNFSNQDLYTAFLGLTPSGSLFPFPEITGSKPVPTGMEFVDTLISASNDIIPLDDTNKSLYKRIYHNIPYLLNSKGTIAGLRALITSYGIPDTILRISEFGGKDQVNANDYDLYFNHFNYCFKTTNTEQSLASFGFGSGGGAGVLQNTTTDKNFIYSEWEVNPSWFSNNNRPSTVQFRFKSEEFPPTSLSQSLWSISGSTSSTAELLLDYTGTGLDSGSYRGAIKDPNFEYANLKFIPDSSLPTVSSSISLPFYNGDWWSVMITTDQNGTYNTYAGNKIYNGNDGTSIGFYSSSSVLSTTDSNWIDGEISIFASSSKNFPNYNHFSGSLQEIRYYNTQISESVFKDFIMNPLSFEGNKINSSPDQLIFRATLGSELDIFTSQSIHPKVTGSWEITQSFTTGTTILNSNQGSGFGSGLTNPGSGIIGNSNYYYYVTPQYFTNTEYFFLDQPAVGIKNRVNDKIRYEDNVLPPGDTLSKYRRISQQTVNSASYTDNINYLEVAFSPQNQINDDIIGQMGHFNVGDYIGDPRQRFTGNRYKDLNNLSEEYFKKYIKNYDLVDFVRLIKFFDNSLFKMIKNFIPTRTSLASGLVIKQHLLERNKYPQPQTSYDDKIQYTGSIETAFISGGTGGMLDVFNSTTTSPSGSLGSGPNNRFDLTQSFVETFLNLTGSSSKTSDSQYEFYDGEFSGSVILVTNGELNAGCDSTKNISTVIPSYGIRSYAYNDWASIENKFLKQLNKPLIGYIQTFYSNNPFSNSPLFSPTYPPISGFGSGGSGGSSGGSQMGAGKPTPGSGAGAGSGVGSGPYGATGILEVALGGGPANLYAGTFSIAQFSEASSFGGGQNTPNPVGPISFNVSQGEMVTVTFTINLPSSVTSDQYDIYMNYTNIGTLNNNGYMIINSVTPASSGGGGSGGGSGVTQNPIQTGGFSVGPSYSTNYNSSNPGSITIFSDTVVEILIWGGS